MAVICAQCGASACGCTHVVEGELHWSAAKGADALFPLLAEQFFDREELLAITLATLHMAIGSGLSLSQVLAAYERYAQSKMVPT